MQIILGFLVTLVLFVLVQQWGRADQVQRHQWLRGGIIWGLVLVLLVLVLTGRLPVLVALGGAMLALLRKLPLLMKAWPWIRKFLTRIDGEPVVIPAPEVSVVETDLLRMVLDRQSGRMEGRVLLGRWQGQALDDMDQENLLALHNEAFKRHLDSLPMLEAYLDQRLGQDWRQGR